MQSICFLLAAFSTAVVASSERSTNALLRGREYKIEILDNGFDSFGTSQPSPFYADNQPKKNPGDDTCNEASQCALNYPCSYSKCLCWNFCATGTCPYYDKNVISSFERCVSNSKMGNSYLQILTQLALHRRNFRLIVSLFATRTVSVSKFIGATTTSLLNENQDDIVQSQEDDEVEIVPFIIFFVFTLDGFSIVFSFLFFLWQIVASFMSTKHLILCI